MGAEKGTGCDGGTAKEQGWVFKDLVPDVNLKNKAKRESTEETEMKNKEIRECGKDE